MSFAEMVVAQSLFVSQNLTGESFVDFPDIDVFHLEFGLFEDGFDAEGWSEEELVDWVSRYVDVVSEVQSVKFKFGKSETGENLTDKSGIFFLPKN